MVKELIDVAILAKRWELKESWIYQHINELPHFKIGHLLRFDPDQLEEYLKKAKRGPKV